MFLTYQEHLFFIIIIIIHLKILNTYLKLQLFFY